MALHASRNGLARRRKTALRVVATSDSLHNRQLLCSSGKHGFVCGASTEWYYLKSDWQLT
eukprot:773091-Amphidinium_carterae.1